jgi:hypothetical protein
MTASAALAADHMHKIGRLKHPPLGMHLFIIAISGMSEVTGLSQQAGKAPPQ